MIDLKALRNSLEQKKGQRSQIQSQIAQTEKRIKRLEKDIRDSEKAQAIIQHVSKQTQEELQYHISELCSLALSAVFDEPYKLELEFVIKRGKTEAEIYFVRNKERINPLSASGGGAVDIASFALRVALWTLTKPKTRNIILLDEPFRFLSRDLQPKASLMLKELSEKLNLQFIMISHSPDLIEGADRVFEISIKKGVSQVKQIN